MLKNTLYIILATLVLASCKRSISPEQLYGKWKYIKVEHPNADPPDSLRKEDLAYMKPYIQFLKSNEVIMVWDGKLLSHGTFYTDGMNIRYKEKMDDGKTREFPFWVVKLTDKEIVFQTTVSDKSRITAVKE